MKKIVLVTAFFISTLSGFAGLNSGSLNSTKLDNPVGKEPMALQPLWPAVSHLAFQKALDVSGVGFSFTFAGETVGPTISQSWRVSGEKRGHSQITTFRHSSGLTVRREVTAFPDYGAIEYTLRFKNESSTTLNELGPIQALDLIFDRQIVPGVSVVSSGGGGCEGSYPPVDFAIQRRDLKSPVMLTTLGGRSSNKDLPFFFIDNDSLKEGLYVAVGWSGQWTAEIKLENGRLHLTACIPGLQIRLQPGEEISGPRMLIGGYHGALAEGSNRLRKLIRLHYTPKLDAKPFAPVATYDHWWDVWTNFDEPLLRKLADAAAEIGQEYFLLDAGWYSGITNPDDFGTGLGNWDDVDSVKFPQGLQPFSNYLTTKGLHFGLWFEPERVAGGSWLARQHPDWVIWLASGPGKEAPDHTGQYGLLNYGLPAVQEWVEKLFDRYISKFDVRYIRYDFNLDPLSYWDSADTDGRRGIAQIRHIEGFYKVIDWVRTHHPKTILEGCASGGRRIDLETARRFHTFWISDQTSEPDIVRWHLHGLNYFLPGNYQYVCFARPKPELEPESSFQDFLGGAFGVGGRIDQWTPETKARTEKHVDVFKKLRRFLMEDYYPLTLQSKDLKSWEAWQFHDPHTQEGFVQAFRLKSEDSSFYVCPRGLQSDAYYRFVDVYSGESLELEGTAAMERGLAFHLAKDESKVFTYQKISYTKK